MQQPGASQIKTRGPFWAVCDSYNILRKGERQFALTTQRIVLMLAIATVAAAPAIAQEDNWKLDADHSTARILLGGNAFNVGVAPVGGKVELNAAEPVNSEFDLSIGPAISFRSRRATSYYGELEVSGELTLTRVVREMDSMPVRTTTGRSTENPSCRPSPVKSRS